MSQAPLLSDLYAAYTEGVIRPQHLWIAGLFAIALVIGWLGARRLREGVQRRYMAARDQGHAASHAFRLSMGGIDRLAGPAIVLAVLLLGREILRAFGVFKGAVDAPLLHLIITLVAALGGIRLVVYVLRRAFPGVAMLAIFERALAMLIWLVVVLHVVGVLPDVVDWLDETTLPIGKTHVSLWLILMGLLSLAVTVLVALWLGSIVEARLLASSLDSNLRLVLARLAKALLLVLAVLIGLSAVGMDLTVLSVFGGALGVGLGLGLQRIASNYVSGFILLLDRSLRLGDMITVNDFHGIVAEISTRYTVLRALDGTEAIVPNEILISSPVTNFTHSDRRSRVGIKVSVAYNTDLKQARGLLLDAAQAHPRALKDPAPGVGITGLGADGINMEVGLWISDPEQGKGNVQSDVWEAIVERFRAANIEIPYPQREVRITHVNPAPPLGD
jgi:small-conductance mechanosensitive channel